MKSSTSTNAPEELEVTIIKKTNNVYSQEIKMKLPSETTFGCLADFMKDEGLLSTNNVIIRPCHNENFIINHDRKIVECYNLVKLRFVMEEFKD